MTDDHHQSLERAEAKVKALSEIIQSSAMIQSSLDRGAILTKVIDASTRLMHADVGSLMILDHERQELVYEVATGEAGRTIDKFRLPVGRGVAGWVAQHGEPVNIPDAYEDPRFFPDHDRATGYRTRSMLCVPLKNRGRVVGIAQVINKMPDPSTFTDDDLEIFQDFATMAAVAVETSRMHDEAMANAVARERIEQELSLAREVQSSFLPAEFPQVPGIRCYAASDPAREVGGDLFDIFDQGDGRIGVVLGDVSGKGVSAALYMAKVCSDLRLLAETHDDVAEVLYHLNNRLTRKAKRGMFVTLLYMEIDPRARRVTLANAGQLPPLARETAKGETFYRDTAASPPLGIAPGLMFHAESFPYQPGGRYVFYTDGITEARNVGKEEYGFERLSRWLTEHGDDEGDLAQSLFCNVKQFSQPADPHDDMTAVVIAFDEGQDPGELATPPQEVLRFTLPARASYLTLVRQTVKRVARDLGFQQRDAQRLVLAVDEGCTNIIRHCYKMDEQGRLEIEIRTYDDRLEVELSDHGETHDPGLEKPRQPRELRPGGLGIYLMQQVCDRVEWRPGIPTGNHLVLTRRRPGTPAPG